MFNKNRVRSKNTSGYVSAEVHTKKGLKDWVRAEGRHPGQVGWMQKRH